MRDAVPIDPHEEKRCYRVSKNVQYGTQVSDALEACKSPINDVKKLREKSYALKCQSPITGAATGDLGLTPMLVTYYGGAAPGELGLTPLLVTHYGGASSGELGSTPLFDTQYGGAATGELGLTPSLVTHYEGAATGELGLTPSTVPLKIAEWPLNLVKIVQRVTSMPIPLLNKPKFVFELTMEAADANNSLLLGKYDGLLASAIDGEGGLIMEAGLEFRPIKVLATIFENTPYAAV
jgi:hypothetical protein